MKIFVLNCRRSSLKFQIFNIEQQPKLLAKGVVEKIGTDNAVFSYTPQNKQTFHKVIEIKNHDMAVKLVLKALTDNTVGVLQRIGAIDAVGHRVVHGGEGFSSPALITPEIIDGIKACREFAPLHNPANLLGIEVCSALIPDTDQIAVFDTAFHLKIPQYAFMYGLPYDVYEHMKIRRYGFHGISHQYVFQQTAEILNRDAGNFKAITCHLDKESSMAAVKNGVSLDTSMGATPLEGLIMETHCGNIDPAIVPYVMAREHLSVREIEDLLNTSSGLKGISKMTRDMREVEEEAVTGSKLHQLALEMFCYSVKKYIGAYFAVLGGIDAVIFTGGIGENSATVRRRVCAGLQCFGITVDERKNQHDETLMSAGPTHVLSVPTNVGLAIAKATYRILHKRFQQRIEEQAALKSQESLKHLSDADKANITLLWSQHKNASPAQLFDIVQREMPLYIDVKTFETLLKNMGLTQQSNTKENI